VTQRWELNFGADPHVVELPSDEKGAFSGFLSDGLPHRYPGGLFHHGPRVVNFELGGESAVLTKRVVRPGFIQRFVTVLPVANDGPEAVAETLRAWVVYELVVGAEDKGSWIATLQGPRLTSWRFAKPGEPLPTAGPAGAGLFVAAALVIAVIALVLAIALGIRLSRTLTAGAVPAPLEWGVVLLVLVAPLGTFAIAALGTRRAADQTFYAQAAANRRNSRLLLITLVGVVTGTLEIITAVLTFNPVPALWAAAIGLIVGVSAAVCADLFGADLVLEAAGAKPARPTTDQVLLDMVAEVGVAAGIPPPRVYVIEDRSQNAFSTGRDPAHASIAVTRGLIDQLNREELEGVIGHELGHIRNLDTRYALYVTVLVGLVAFVADAFQRGVERTWARGGFFVTSGDNPLASLIAGVVVGLLLLAFAKILGLVAPLFAAMVQAAVSREREFLADATAVELTRDPRGLERALAAIADDRNDLKAANRGTQHLWFRNPVTAGSDRRTGIFATHPSIGARIERLRRLEPPDPTEPAVPAALQDET